MDLKAIIMAGGRGERLRPLTNDKPKPMVDIIGKPIIEYIVRYLKDYEIYDISITLGYRAQDIINYLGDGSRYGVNISYFVENEPLGTAGSVKNAASDIDSDFLVLGGDAFTDIDLKGFYNFHRQRGGIGTLALKTVFDPTGFGVVKTDANGKIKEFIEKPKTEARNIAVNTGIYMFRPEILDAIPKGFYDFGKQLFPTLSDNLYGYHAEGYWNDIGTLSSYYDTNLYVVKNIDNYQRLLF